MGAREPDFATPSRDCEIFNDVGKIVNHFLVRKIIRVHTAFSRCALKRLVCANNWFG